MILMVGTRQCLRTNVPINETSMKPTLYIANALGFNTHARDHTLCDIVAMVRGMGFGAIEPFADNNELSLARERTIAQELEIARLDTKGVEYADGVLCIISSQIPDEGSMIEVGMAIAWNKPVFYLNDDFRYRPTNTALPMNLMLFARMTPETWEQYYYTSIESLSDPSKALYKWFIHINCDVNSILAPQLHCRDDDHDGH